jgi:hypothetical protein
MNVSAQLEVFRTADDLKNNTPEINEGYDFKGYSGTRKDIVIKLENGAGEKKEIACADIWGIRYKGDLYRVVKLGKYYQSRSVSNVLVILDMGGADNLCYYVYGMNVLKARSKGKNGAVLLDVACPFVSNGIFGDFAALPIADLHMDKDLKENLTTFFAEFPQYKEAQADLSTNGQGKSFLPGKSLLPKGTRYDYSLYDHQRDAIKQLNEAH